MVQSSLPRPISDHSPIILEVGGILGGPIPLYYEVMWLRVEGFKDLLRNWWKSLSFNDSYNLILDSKLKFLKTLLKSWNRNVFGRVELKSAGPYRGLASGVSWKRIDCFQWRNLWREIWPERITNIGPFGRKFFGGSQV